MKKVVFKSAQLLYPTTIFVEAPNLIFYADAQVLAKLFVIIDKDSGGKYKSLFPKIGKLKDLDYPALQKMVQTKTSHNILYDIADWGICINRKGKDQTVFTYLDQLYRILLYRTDDIATHFAGTSIGCALKALISHENMKRLTVYLAENSPSIHQDLSQLFSTTSEKLELVHDGELGTAIYAANADTYFLNHIQDVDHVLMIPEIKPREIYIPDYDYNHNIDAGLENGDSAQIEYFNKFKVSINYVHLPF